MSRPALAASRGAQILDLLASFPERRCSLTEIARATGINLASCLAILGELVRSGHLSRHARHKTYWLGPVAVAAGGAAMAANPVLDRALRAGETLRAELGLPVLLSTRVGDEIVCVFSLPDADGRGAGLRPGERVPLTPPIGTSFVAWAPPGEADAWIARRTEAGAAPVAARLREALAQTRARGFHVTLRAPGREDLTTFLARIATGGPAPEPQRQIEAFVAGLDVEAAQPDTLDTDRACEVRLIAAPVIDPETRAIHNLCLGGFRAPLPGNAVAALGRRLVAACLGVMRGGED